MRSVAVFFAVFFAVLLIAVPTHADVSPAMAMGVTTTGILNIANSIMPSIIDGIRAAEFPGESGKSSGFKYSISNIHLTKLTYAKLILNANNDGFTAGIQDLSVGISFKWSYKRTKIPWLPRGSGKADAALNGATITATFGLGRTKVDGKDRLNVVVKSASAHIDKVSVHVKGSLLSWLYNLVISLFKNKIRHSIENAIVEGFKTNVNARIAQILSTMKLISPVSNWGVIDLSMPRNPVHYKNSRGDAWTFNFNGEVYPASTQKPLNVVTRPNMPWTTVNRDFELNFSFFTLNSAAAVWHKERKWNSVTSESNTPKGFPVALNTNAWKAHLPNLQNTYGSQPIEIKTSLAEFPTAWTNGNQVAFKSAYDIEVRVQGKTAFIIRAGGESYIAINTRNNAIVPRIDDMTGTFTLVKSNVGNFDLRPVEFIFNAVLKLVVVPAINQELFAGFPLPTIGGLSFNKPSVTVYPNYVVVGFDADYKP